MKTLIIFLGCVLGILLLILVAGVLKSSSPGGSALPEVSPGTQRDMNAATFPSPITDSVQGVQNLSPTPDPFMEQTVPLRLDPDVLQKWTEFAAIVTPANESSSAENVPLYPGAQQVITKESSLQHQPPIFEYYTTDTAEHVAAFYQAILTRNGWRLLEENAWDSHASLVFLWSDSEDASPCRLWFEMRVDARGTWETYKSVGPAEVYARVERWPLAGKVPVYPGAHDIEVKSVAVPGTYPDRLTTYIATAEPAEIEEYYKTTLAKCGWGYGNYTGKEVRGFGAISDGLVFSFLSGGPEGAWYGSLSITAKRNSNGRTYVEMLAGGADLPHE